MYSYDLRPYFQPLPHDDKSGVWAKIPLINDTLITGKYDFVVWMDFDTLFTNMKTRIEDFLQDVQAHHVDRLHTGQRWEDVDMIITPDW